MEIRRDKQIPPGAKVKLLLVLGWLKSCNALLWIVQKILFRSKVAPKNILVFRTGSLGDNICAIPSLVAIRKRFPDARMDILVNSGGSNLVALEQLLDPTYYDKIINYLNIPKKEVILLMRKQQYDLVIQLPQTGSPFSRLLRDMLFFRLFCKSGFGWKLSTIPFFRQTQEDYIKFDNETHRLAKLLNRYGIIVDEEFYALNITRQDEALVDETLSLIKDKRECLAIVVGAKRPQNRWPIQYFNEVIQAFIRRYNILLIGGPEDRAITAGLQFQEGLYNFCGKFTPLQSAVVLKKCKLVISNDTGPMHLTYAVNTPVVAIFSSRDFPGKWFPPTRAGNKVFRSYGIHCSLCLSDNCTDNICMKQIKPQTVINQIEAMLAS